MAPTKSIELLSGFPAIADQHARILILGSMPSVSSLQKQQYYAHPRNAFWPIMGGLLGALPELDYQDRLAILMANGVAVWDVLKNCHRPGSLDSAIVADSMTSNDFDTFFNNHPDLQQVFFNGATAEKVYRRQVMPQLADLSLNLYYQRLPSTSPAHAAMSLAQKMNAWEVIKTQVTCTK